MSKQKQVSINESDQFGVSVIGHVKIEDDLGKVHVDKPNAIHPQNMSRIITRALSNESNFWIHKMVFGNGGTITDAAFQITYKTPNDGQLPDTAAWASRIYNETYSEIVDELSGSVGTGEGSDTSNADDTGNSVISNENGTLSELVIQCVLNPDEPAGQSLTDNLSPVESTTSDFTFDEIGLYTTGLPPTSTAGYQNVDVSTKIVTDDTGLSPSTLYTFNVEVDGGSQQVVNVTTPGSGSGSAGEILYSDLISLINGVLNGATASISDPDAFVNTFGFLKFTSDTTGASSSVVIEDLGIGNYPVNFVFSNLLGFQNIDSNVVGQDAGVQNNVSDSATERERLLTHVIFSPVLKSSNRTLTVTYTITVAVARTVV